MFVSAAVSINTVPSLKILAHYAVWTVREVMRVSTVIAFLTNPMHKVSVAMEARAGTPVLSARTGAPLSEAR